ncbi:MAG TPA: hypothetical protein VFG54_07190 [Prolixibacteraceae bacterium]|nr:hypothetical protein [Prolixibacteraceae bacterium]
MRILSLIITLLIVLQGYSQTDQEIRISGIIADADSIPIPDVIVVNSRTLNIVRSNPQGFFQSSISGNDSLFIFHVSYKRRFISEKDNGRVIILEPEINELKQVDVTDKYLQELKNLQQTMEDIKRVAPLKKLSEEEMKSIQTRFVEQHGSHNKGFKPYFGPKVRLPFWKIAELAGLDKQTRQRKQLTSHYHFTKKKSPKRNK